MSGPQVAGVVACLAEQEPFLTQAEALQHLKENALAEVGTTGTINHSNNGSSTGYEAFGDSHNRYLFMPKRDLKLVHYLLLSYIRIGTQTLRV